MNIEGKRSGDGFVAHKVTLVSALSRALAERITLMDFTIGRKGFLGYLKALGGSNIVKVVPSACVPQTNGHKRLKVVCGANTSFLDDNAWIGDNTPMTLADVRVSPNNSVKPNIGSLELAEALNRVIPFTAKEDNRPVLQCVLFKAGEGKLTIVSADGFRLAMVTLDFEGEGQALVMRDELRGIANALKRAKRARLDFEAEHYQVVDEAQFRKAKDANLRLDDKTLILDTELIRYKWTSTSGDYPDYQKLIPTQFNASASFDAIEALKAVNSLKVLADAKTYPTDLAIGNGKLVMSNTEDKGQAEINADTDGDGKTRIDGSYLADALRACGGMVDFKLTNAYSPMVFAVDGYQLVVMPMMTNEGNEQAKQDSKAREAEAEAKAEQPSQAVAQAEAVAEAVTQAEAVAEAVTDKPSDDELVADYEARVEAETAKAEREAEAEKPKRKRKAKEPVAVA